MTPALFLFLYVACIIVTFFLAPIVSDADTPYDLVMASVLFPLFWCIVIVLEIFSIIYWFAEWYLKILEKRNEK